MSNFTAFTQPKTRKFINLKFLIGAFDADPTTLDDKDCPFTERGIPVDRIETFELHRGCARTCEVVITGLNGIPTTHLIRGTTEGLVYWINGAAAAKSEPVNAEGLTKAQYIKRQSARCGDQGPNWLAAGWRAA
jgi:hypothetical protein